MEEAASEVYMVPLLLVLIALLGFAALLLVLLIWRLFVARGKLKRFKPVGDAEDELNRLREVQAQETHAHQEKMRQAQQEMASFQGRIQEVAKQYQLRSQELEQLSRKHNLASKIDELVHRHDELRTLTMELEEHYDLQLAGFYTPRYDFLESAAYSSRLQQIRDKQKALVKEKKAIVYTTEWAVQGSKAKGRQQMGKIIRLALSSFNTQADNVILRVSYKNIQRSEEKLRKIAANTNKLLEMQHAHVTNEYLNLKVEELYLAFEYQEMLQQEKEEAQAHREQLKQEQEETKELARQLKEAEQRRKEIDAELHRLQREKDLAAQHQEQTDALMERIRLLEQGLAEAQENERAISQAQLTRRGHVYIISNIGSFGEGVYKIGMTRRLDPMLRVKELGDASVPFTFDVHGMIFSEDAPALEKHLHDTFDKRRVNRVNNRKEFFRVSLDEISRALQGQGVKTDLRRVHEAKEYRQSQDNQLVH